MPIIPPIFVWSDDLYVFPSKEYAESCIEPVDASPGEYGYDSEGRLIHVVVRGDVKQGRWSVDQSQARVELVLAEEEPHHREELYKRLAEWLERAGGSKSELSTANLEDLVERAMRYSFSRTAVPTKSIRWIVIALVSAGVAVWLCS